MADGIQWCVCVCVCEREREREREDTCGDERVKQGSGVLLYLCIVCVSDVNSLSLSFSFLLSFTLYKCTRESERFSVDVITNVSRFMGNVSHTQMLLQRREGRVRLSSSNAFLTTKIGSVRNGEKTCST